MLLVVKFFNWKWPISFIKHIFCRQLINIISSCFYIIRLSWEACRTVVFNLSCPYRIILVSDSTPRCLNRTNVHRIVIIGGIPIIYDYAKLFHFRFFVSGVLCQSNFWNLKPNRKQISKFFKTLTKIIAKLKSIKNKSYF